MISNLKDLATSKVATAPSPATSGTSLVVTAGHGTRFPLPPFIAICHPDNQLPESDTAEAVKVTAVSTDTLTIERGFGFYAPDGGFTATTAKSIATGWRISVPVTTESLDKFSNSLLFWDATQYPIGTVMCLDSVTGTYVEAVATQNDEYADAVGIVSDVEGPIDLGAGNVYQHKLVTSGLAYLSSLPGSSAVGDTLYLSPTVAGALTLTEPTTPGHVSKPIGTVVSTSTVSIMVNIMRGMEIDEGWGSTSFVSDETPAGLVNSSNTSYTASSGYSAGTMEVFINGLKQIRNTDYTETNPTTGVFSMTTAPVTGDIIRINYMTGSFGTGNADTLDGYQAADFAILSPSGGGYTLYTASFNGFTIGNGTQAMYYQKTGKLVTVFGKITLGSTSVMTGELRVSMPTTVDTIFSNNSGSQSAIRLFDTSANTSYQGIVLFSTTEIYIRALNASGTYETHTAITSAIPFTWADTDYVRIFAQYIEA